MQEILSVWEVKGHKVGKKWNWDRTPLEYKGPPRDKGNPTGQVPKNNLGLIITLILEAHTSLLEEQRKKSRSCHLKSSLSILKSPLNRVGA